MHFPPVPCYFFHLWPEYLPQHAILESPQPMLFPHYDRPSCTPMKQHTTFFFCVNRHCNPCGFWPARLSLIILSRKVFTECPNLEDQWLERSNSRHQVSPTSEMTRANPSSGRWNYGRENSREFCRKWRLPRHFWVLLHAVNLRHGTDDFISPPKEGVLRIFSPEKSDGFCRVWIRELGYQRPSRLPLDHRSRYIQY